MKTTPMFFHPATLESLRLGAIHTRVRGLDRGILERRGLIVLGPDNVAQLTAAGWDAVGTDIRDYAIEYAYNLASRVIFNR